MAQWGRNDQAVTANATTTAETSNGAPIGTYVYVKGDQVARTGSANAHFGNTSPGSRANVDVRMFNNVTAGEFIPNIAVGVFGVDTTEIAVTNKGIPHAGWNLRTVGTGPIIGATGTGGSGFANGETITISNGSSNATLTITSNATGNIASLVITSGGGGFVSNATAVRTFTRQKHLVDITVGGTSSGYSNTDVITASNGIVNATATFTTNATGGFSTANVTNVGLFGASQTNAQVVFTVANSTGGASGGTGATFTANIGTSTGGSVLLTLGGRAGRVQYETLVAMGSLGATDAKYGTAAITADASDDSVLPDA